MIYALVDVLLAVGPSVARWTVTPVTVDQVHTGGPVATLVAGAGCHFCVRGEIVIIMMHLWGRFHEAAISA